MDDADYGTFERAFGRVIGAFRVKLKAEEREELTRTYFRVLEPHPTEAVLLAGKVCLKNCRTFPKLAEWVAAIGAPVGAPANVRQMSTTEVDEHERAIALRYRDHPCVCAECCRAGVEDRERRYVPYDDEDRAYHPHRQRVEIAGHWIHGEALRRWYDARDAFYALAAKHPRVLALVLQREPGEEG